MGWSESGGLGSSTSVSFVNGLTLDITELSEVTKTLMEMVSDETVQKAMNSAAGKLKSHAKKGLWDAVKPHYDVTAGNFKKSVRSIRVAKGGGNSIGVSVTVPLLERRGANGGGKMYRHIFGGGTPNVGFNILKGGNAALPSVMPASYGGNPPFIPTTMGRNMGAVTKKFVVTRKTKNRLPLMGIVGESPVQFPMERGKDATKNDFEKFFCNALEHALMYYAGFTK